MMKISKRLKTLSNLVSKNSKVADIGTDHGFVPNFLVENNISNYVICSDISEESLQKSISLIESMGNEKHIKTRVGDGLSVLNKGEVDTVIIAGMGGQLISKILKSEIELVKELDKIILQPMQGQELLRKFLYENGFNIVDELIVYEDGSYFEIIVTKYDGIIRSVNKIFYEIPKILLDRKDPILKDFLTEKIKYNNSIIDEIKDYKSEKVRDRVEELSKINNRYKELLCTIK
ncbi:tRNA (adenine(22)-N(1))-methyltransferase [Anaerosphaera multitolerans]|uniref:SAM-dependent methyltransferase n=1 Tax=Anaerosphaera multitolerans TaxID=2487351 RepID=A0A437S8A8_9FIRM|nr:class I SAM-dependent methyltransferase [Anaerosphaera multitolerans]RVU55313.1 SAM-dependent methyltransferase [Anaerosphaera multitolerans]